jgi:hypothetical protein
MDRQEQAMTDAEQSSAKSNTPHNKYDASSGPSDVPPPRPDKAAPDKTPADKVAAKPEPTRAKTDKPRPSLVAITIDATTAQVVKLEALDATGARHELSEDEKAKLVTEGREDNLEEVVEQAFEAGIACILDGTNGQETSKESAEDAELRHLLITPLIESSPAKHLMERAVLNRAILGTLMRHTPTSRAASPPGAAP